MGPKRKRLIAPVVYVDELTVYPNAWGPFLKGSCHLTCSNLNYLHRFAQRIGLRREWFQEHPRPEFCHYDLTAGMRQKALRNGAVFKPIREQVREWLKKAPNVLYRVEMGELCGGVVVRHGLIVGAADVFKWAKGTRFSDTFEPYVKRHGGTLEKLG